MRRVWTVARHEYLSNVRRKGFIFATVLVPLLMLVGALVASLAGGQASDLLRSQFAPEPRAIGVVDQQGRFSPILPAHRARFIAYPSEEAARQAVEADDVSAVLIVPATYLEDGRVALLSKDTGPGAMAVVDSTAMRAFFTDHLLRDTVDPALRARLANPIDPMLVTLGGEAQGTGWEQGVSFIVSYMLSFLLIITMFVSSGYLLRSVSYEKTTRVIEVVLSSIPAWQLLAGKVLGLGALGLTQVSIWLATALLLITRAEVFSGLAGHLFTRPEILALALVYYLLGFLVFAALMGGVGAVGTSMQESQQLAGFFTFIAVIPMMMSGILVTNPNMLAARVMSWFPLTSPTMMLMRLGFGEVPVEDVVGSIAVLAFTVPVLLWAGAKVFRMGLLMYGKRPSVGQMMRVLRQA